jgi:hypothetical protein
MIGAGTGALLGAWIAHRTRHSRGTHRALRWGGGGLFLFGLVGAVVMFVGPEQGRGSLATIEECALGMGGVVLAVIGVFFWLAGFSGSRLGGSAAPTNSLPLA